MFSESFRPGVIRAVAKRVEPFLVGCGRIWNGPLNLAHRRGSAEPQDRVLDVTGLDAGPGEGFSGQQLRQRSLGIASLQGTQGNGR